MVKPLTEVTVVFGRERERERGGGGGKKVSTGNAKVYQLGNEENRKLMK